MRGETLFDFLLSAYMYPSVPRSPQLQPRIQLLFLSLARRNLEEASTSTAEELDFVDGDMQARAPTGFFCVFLFSLRYHIIVWLMGDALIHVCHVGWLA